MSSLPDDIYLNILTRTPVKSLLICKSVYKNWFKLIFDPDFVKMHLNRTAILRNDNNCNLILKRAESRGAYSMSYCSLSPSSIYTPAGVDLETPCKYLRDRNTMFFNSCHGLVYGWNSRLKIFFLWNPTTKEYKRLPKSDTNYKLARSGCHIHGFGYDYKTDDYKLVSIYHPKNKEGSREADRERREGRKTMTKKNKVVVFDDLEKLLKDGSKVRKVTMMQFFYEFNNGVRQKIDERWEHWMSSSYQLWEKKNEEEQQIDLHMRWTYLRDLLRREGIDTSNHRLLLSMRFIDREGRATSKAAEEILEFRVGSPDRGLVTINRLVLDHGSYFHGSLPRQTVSGLLCFATKRKDAFLIFNPITGERSPWIETNKPGRIAFGFNPQSDEHKVICISEQVVEIFTVGKNTWRRIDAVPPISIGHEAPFSVGGCLYWRFREPEDGGLEQIMRFDIVAEKFRVILIPNYVVDSGRHKWSQTVELTEVDGSVVVLNWINELNISLSTIHEDAHGNITWDQEMVNIPPHWNGKPDLSIEALTGKNLIFILYEASEFFFITIEIPRSP